MSMPGSSSICQRFPACGIQLPLFLCPSRGRIGPFGNNGNTNYVNTANPVPSLTRADYAANVGDVQSDEMSSGPASLADVDNGTYALGNTDLYTGIVFRRSKITFAMIRRGTSNTYMAGKKYLNPDHFGDRGDGSDNENMYFGFDNDICRDTYSPPMQDLAGFPDQQRFGSNHTGSVNMLYCDGSVGNISFSVDPAIHKSASNRRASAARTPPE